MCVCVCACAFLNRIENGTVGKVSRFMSRQQRYAPCFSSMQMKVLGCGCCLLHWLHTGIPGLCGVTCSRLDPTDPVKRKVSEVTQIFHPRDLGSPRGVLPNTLAAGSIRVAFLVWWPAPMPRLWGPTAKGGSPQYRYASEVAGVQGDELGKVQRQKQPGRWMSRSPTSCRPCGSLPCACPRWSPEWRTSACQRGPWPSAWRGGLRTPSDPPA